MIAVIVAWRLTLDARGPEEIVVALLFGRCGVVWYTPGIRPKRAPAG